MLPIELIAYIMTFVDNSSSARMTTLSLNGDEAKIKVKTTLLKIAHVSASFRQAVLPELCRDASLRLRTMEGLEGFARAFAHLAPHLKRVDLTSLEVRGSSVGCAL